MSVEQIQALADGLAAGEQVGATISRHVGMRGTAAAPQEAWLVQREIKTLGVRMPPVGVSDSLLRLSIGLEDCEELIADLAQAPAD